MTLYDLLYILEEKNVIEIKNRGRLYAALDSASGPLCIDGEGELPAWDGTSWGKDKRTYREIQRIDF